jgi:outer membrane lipoprotein SlyB
VWIGIGALALSGVAGASYLLGRSATRDEPEPPPVQAAEVQQSPAPRQAAQHTPATPAKAEPERETAAAPACADCGVVESVQAVTRKGEGSGVGAVAGGVVGGLIGNQMGAGQGKTAMTVLGAVGGGFAGHEVEKRARSTTVYKVRVRTDEGQLRTFEQAQAPAVGQRVRIDGRQLHTLPTQG